MCSVLGGGVTDPVGFYTYSFPGGSPETRTTFGVSLVNPAYQTSVSSVSGTKVTIPGVFDAADFANGGIFEVSAGVTRGLTLDLLNFATLSPELHELTLSRPVDGLIAAGDNVNLRRHTTLGDIFGFQNEGGVKAGLTAKVADTMAFWDLESQTSRVFYRHSLLGWVEDGKEAEGDKSDTPFRFPAGAVFTRRGSAPLEFTIAGHVLVPLDERVFPVKKGANIYSMPFSGAEEYSTYTLFEEGSPFSIQAGASAPEADVLIFTNIESGEAQPPVYYQKNDDGEHWQFVGGGDASTAPVFFIPALQLYRAGDDGFIRFHGASIAKALVAPGHRELPPAGEGVEVSFKIKMQNQTRAIIQWSGESGADYQIEKRSSTAAVWSKVGTPVTGGGSNISRKISLKGAGRIRVVKR